MDYMDYLMYRDWLWENRKSKQKNNSKRCEMYKEFTKADLKNGMVVEQRGGTRKIVINDRLIGYDSFGELKNYEDNLLKKVLLGSSDLDIVKIYQPTNTLYDFIEGTNLKLIWQRQEKPNYKEITIAEIEEKFGCKVKIVDKNTD
jgi:hypothetical protein